MILSAQTLIVLFIAIIILHNAIMLRHVVDDTRNENKKNIGD